MEEYSNSGPSFFFVIVCGPMIVFETFVFLVEGGMCARRVFVTSHGHL